VAHGRCLTLRAPSGVAARGPAAAGAERRFVKVAGPKAARRAEVIAAGLAGAMQAARPRARAAATQVEDNGGWHAIEVDGTPGRSRETTTTTDGDRPSETVLGEAEATQKVDGA